MEKIEKIITHSGRFHADELLAITTLYMFGNHNFETFQSFKTVIQRVSSLDINDEVFDNPSIYILDIGRRYEPSLNNYDHHQNKDIEATNLLVLNQMDLSTSYQGLTNEDMIYRLKKNLYNHVDMCDRGLWKDWQVDKDTNVCTFNSLVASYNSLDNGFGFVLALDFVFNQLNIIKSKCLKECESFGLFDEYCYKVTSKVFYTTECLDIPNYKEVLYKRDCVFFVAPNREDGKYSLSTIDNKKYPLVEYGIESFMHPAKFISVYNNFDDALSSALENANHYNLI